MPNSETVNISLSPCNNQCQNDFEDAYCTSCFRTTEEKKTWWKFTDEEKRAILDDLPSRAKKW